MCSNVREWWPKRGHRGITVELPNGLDVEGESKGRRGSICSMGDLQLSFGYVNSHVTLRHPRGCSQVRPVSADLKPKEG